MTQEEIKDINEWWEAFLMVGTSIKKRMWKRPYNQKVDEFFAGKLKVRNWKTKELLDPSKYRNLREYLYLRVEPRPLRYIHPNCGKCSWREDSKSTAD